MKDHCAHVAAYWFSVHVQIAKTQVWAAYQWLDNTANMLGECRLSQVAFLRGMQALRESEGWEG